MQERTKYQAVNQMAFRFDNNLTFIPLKYTSWLTNKTY